MPALAQSSGASSAGDAQNVPDAPADSTFDQVVLGLRGNFDPRSGKAEIDLQPPNLGMLHVSIQLDSGSLTAQFRSGSDVVRDLLKNNLDKLKEVLEAQGVAVDKLTVTNAPDRVAHVDTGQSSTTGSPNHDGRSAGEYRRDGSQDNGSDPRRRQPDPSAFARTWRNASAVPSPIDMVA